MPKRTILQKGKPNGFLFVFCHIGPLVIKQPAMSLFPDATVVVELWGEGTAAYEPLLDAYGGGMRSLARGIAETVGHEFSHVNLTTWSAGSQVAKKVLASADLPDSVVMLDGLYGSKLPDGSVDGAKSNLDGVVNAIKLATREDSAFSLMGTYSNIPTPYASSKECWEYAIDKATQELGYGFGPDTFCTSIDGRKFINSRRLNNMQLYEFAGKNASEHCANARMFTEFWQRLMQSAVV